MPSIRGKAWEQSANVPSVTASLTGIPWESTARCSLLFSPLLCGQWTDFRAGAVGMGLDIAGVYHQPLEIRVINHRLQQSGPHAPVPPAAEAAVGVLPISVVRGQISPRSASAQYPAHGVDKPPVVLGRSAPLALSPGQMRPQPLPNRIGHIVARCATVIPPPSTLSPFPAIYHPTAILRHPLANAGSVGAIRSSVS